MTVNRSCVSWVLVMRLAGLLNMIVMGSGNRMSSPLMVTRSFSGFTVVPGLFTTRPLTSTRLAWMRSSACLREV